jgi:hypothetical protein
MGYVCYTSNNPYSQSMPIRSDYIDNCTVAASTLHVLLFSEFRRFRIYRNFRQLGED